MLTAAEMAARLRCSERTLARMVSEGCPSMLVRRRRRFDAAVVTDWIEKQGAACRAGETKRADGTPKQVSAANAFTDAARRVQLRVMPSCSKQS